ncbi:MAG TPA: NAD-dependent epimerase/dehydratase family protein, partial [Acidimicrobiales bacterium]
MVVTGATGNVGTALVDLLADDPAVGEVVGVARREPDPAGLPDGVRLVTADVAEDPLEDVFAGADAVVHLAWLFQPTHDPMTTWRANALGSARVFDAAAAAGVRALVHASSVGVYSPGEGRTVDETWPTHSTPMAAYGREKAYAERVLDAVEARHPDLRVVRLRPAFIFRRASGTQQRRLFAGPFLPGPLVRRGRVPVVPLPQGLRFQALHTLDAAEAYRAAVLEDGASGAYNVAAEPVIDAGVLGEVLGAKTVSVPRWAVRGAV